MKKIYKNPETKVVSIQTSQIIAVSTVNMYGTNATGTGMSRRAWSDDEDED